MGRVVCNPGDMVSGGGGWGQKNTDVKECFSFVSFHYLLTQPVFVLVVIIGHRLFGE